MLLASEILAVHAASAAPEFPLDLVHVHISRIGLNPPEERLAAHLPTINHHSRRHPA